MGKLVHFVKRGHDPKARTADADQASGGNAQIYLFTGVRYQREGAPVPGKPLRRSRAKRTGA